MSDVDFYEKHGRESLLPEQSFNHPARNTGTPAEHAYTQWILVPSAIAVIIISGLLLYRTTLMKKPSPMYPSVKFVPVYSKTDREFFTNATTGQFLP